MLLSTEKKIYERSSKNLVCSIKHLGKYKTHLMLGISTQSVFLHMIFLFFTLLYSIMQLKINLLITLKEPFKEKALLTLHRTKDTHISHKQTACMVLSKCM